jgi:dihydroorotase
VLKWGEASGLGLAQTLAAVTSRPCAVLARSSRSATDAPSGLAVGAPADLCVFDPAVSWQLDSSRLLSRSRHTPFEGSELLGRVRWTLVAGRVAHDAGADLGSR